MKSEREKSCRSIGERIKRPLGLISLGLLLFVICFFLPSIPDRYSDLKSELSLNLVDRDGRSLRREVSARDGVNDWTNLDQKPELLVTAIVLAEDKHYQKHSGIDFFAILRAFKDNLQAGRVVSGASTITQQTLRTFGDGRAVTLTDKLREA